MRTGIVPASDGSGVVVAVGDRVQEFKVGDKVITLFNQGHQAGPVDLRALQTGLGGAIDGTLREYGIFPETGLAASPKNLNWEEASTLSCAALTSWNALFGLKPLKAGEYVLVQGTGGVSVFALQVSLGFFTSIQTPMCILSAYLQFAKASGAFVVATTSSEEKAKKLRALGADYVINYKTTPEWGKVARELTPNSEGFDHIIEVGGPTTLRQTINCIKFEGVISIIGFVGGEKYAKNVSFTEILENVCTVRGLVVGSRAQLKEMVRAIEINNIKPAVDEKVFKFEEVKEAYQYMWDQKHFGKFPCNWQPRKTAFPIYGNDQLANKDDCNR